MYSLFICFMQMKVLRPGVYVIGSVVLFLKENAF